SPRTCPCPATGRRDPRRPSYRPGTATPGPSAGARAFRHCLGTWGLRSRARGTGVVLADLARCETPSPPGLLSNGDRDLHRLLDLEVGEELPRRRAGRVAQDELSRLLARQGQRAAACRAQVLVQGRRRAVAD